MKKNFLITTLICAFALTSFGSFARDPSRAEAAMAEDTTERLENIAELKSSMRSLKIQIKTLNIALVEAKKHKSKKKLWNNTKKISDAITALTILSGAIASYHFENKAKVLKIASFVGGLSSSVSVITGLLAEMSTDQVEIVTNKIEDIMPILKATEINLNSEVKLLCKQEPSNQMCK